MTKVITAAFAICAFLTIAKAAAPKIFHFLPLGGSAIAEAGIVVISAIAIFQLWTLLFG